MVEAKSLDSLIQQLNLLPMETLDENTAKKFEFFDHTFYFRSFYHFRKSQLQNHRMKDALYNVLCEIKDKTG